LSLYYSVVSGVILSLLGEKEQKEIELNQKNLSLWLTQCALNRKRL
jgi:hypothetical protein